MTGAAFPPEHTNPPKAGPFLGTRVYNIFQEKKTREYSLQVKHFSQSIPGHLLLKFCSCSFSFLPAPKDDSGKGEKKKIKIRRDGISCHDPSPTSAGLTCQREKRLSEIEKMRSEISMGTKEESIAFLKLFILSFAESGVIPNFMFSFGGRFPKSTLITLHLISPNSIIFGLS